MRYRVSAVVTSTLQIVVQARSVEEAVRNMEHSVLVQLAQELTQKVKKNIKIDWSTREGTRAELRVLVRNLLDKYGYPPDFSKAAVDLVILQAESLTEEWLNDEIKN
jgi:type I restriction enzyme R subunit